MSDRKLRLFELAKELGVPSKSIIEKCKAEGIEVKTHMHPMSAGLEATVREWFSEGAHSTTAEESGRVDLEVVRKAVRPRKKAAAKKGEEGGVAVMEPQQAEHADGISIAAEAPALVEQRATMPAVGIVETREVAEAPIATPTRPVVEAVPPPGAPVAPAPPPVVVEAPVTPAAPAGPQNIPQPAKLAGPKLIRMDRPEEVARPRPMPRPAARGPYGGGPPSAPAAPKADEPRSRRGPSREGDRGGPALDDAPGVAGDRKRSHPRRGERDFDKAGEILREWRDRDLIERRERLSHASGRGIAGMRAVEEKAPARRGFQPTPAKKTKVELSEPITIKDFSRESGITVVEIVKRLMETHGQMAQATSVIDSDIAQLIAAEYGLELVITKAKSALDRLSEEFAALPRKHLETRPPVVTVLGHVDHGKTSLLDRIRKTNVAGGEAGGITQHIGAYRVKVGERWVTFLDTPGHTAFTAMRARGANLTDVVVLVVAADDGVMPTTIEAINHARAAGTPIVVALNKSDLPHDINKIYGQLSQHGLTPSGDWGGDTDVIKTSAITGAGVEELLNHLATLSDVLDLKADASLPATGRVIEAQRLEGSGNVARLMVQEGTLKPGHFLVCGSSYGKVRAIKDDQRKTVNKAGPSTPVEVMGLNDLPQAGDRFFGVPSLQLAKDAAEELSLQRRQAELARASAKPKTLESMLASAAEGIIPTLNVILRADVQGSVDVLEKTLSEFPTNQVRLIILNKGVGAITESDVVLAQASDALIIGFYVLPEPSAARLADESQVPIRTYRVIYEVLDDIKKALEDRLPPEEKIESRGRAEVREVFHISRLGKVAGCLVRDGVIGRNHLMRVIRDAVVVKEGAPVESLKRFKDDAREVKAGLECGIKLGNFDDVKPGDVLESYEIVKTARTLD